MGVKVGLGYAISVAPLTQVDRAVTLTRTALSGRVELRSTGFQPPRSACCLSTVGTDKTCVRLQSPPELERSGFAAQVCPLYTNLTREV